jgi:P-type Mg2+ transporter
VKGRRCRRHTVEGGRRASTLQASVQLKGKPPLPTGDSAFWAWSTADAFAALATSSDGLTRAEAAGRLRRSGAVAPHHRRVGLVLLLRQFANPITLILVFATVVSAVLGEATDAAIILAIILLSGLLSFWQEYAASRAVEDLMARVQVTVEVFRNSQRSFPATR